MGGEEDDAIAIPPILKGLPPRGRGRVIDEENGKVKKRITPAWAGKRMVGLDDTKIRKDYPRVGGEESNSLINPGNTLGLPPRGRGRVYHNTLP